MLRKTVYFFLALSASAFSQNTASLDSELEQLRAKHNLPALAALAMIDGKIVANSAVGVRRFGSPEKVSDSDKWHLGSCTKSMTATLAAMFVERGKLRWNTTVGEIFPEWRDMKPEWRGVTMEQLLTHRSGAPHDAPPDLWSEAWKESGTATQQRLAFVRGLVTRTPEAPPGTKYIYSNQGYAIAGAMIERVAHQSWENLMREKIFEPLAMTSAGFGAPANGGHLEQPWGHVFENGKIKPIAPGRAADNPPAIGPAATVHCSLADFARYADLHTRGFFADTPLLKRDTFLKLHTSPADQQYAFGWITGRRWWANGETISHMGSNTMFVTDVWIAPQKKAVLISATNIATDGAFKAADDTINVLIQRFLK